MPKGTLQRRELVALARTVAAVSNVDLSQSNSLVDLAARVRAEHQAVSSALAEGATARHCGRRAPGRGQGLGAPWAMAALA
jgi:hypothetical protein